MDVFIKVEYLNSGWKWKTKCPKTTLSKMENNGQKFVLVPNGYFALQLTKEMKRKCIRSAEKVKMYYLNIA